MPEVQPRPRGGERLLLATTNPAKLERLRWVFAPHWPSVPLPSDAGPGPAETGDGFRANAELKAIYWSRSSGGLAAASDGGLTIPALGAAWQPLRTARSAGPGADDLTRARHLLELARSLRGEQRAAYWTEGLALARDGRLLRSWESSGTRAYLVESFEPTGLKPGFWAASLCYVPDFGKTLAELADEQLPKADPTWSGLRDRVQAYATSGQ